MKRTALLLVVLASCLAFGIARAELGGDRSSVLADATSLQGVVQSSTPGPYSVQQILAPSGVLVREYLSAQGRVFAVSWTGPVVPNLAGLLGHYYAPYAAALAARSPAELRRSADIVLPDLVVQSSGHLRAYSGRAYLTQQLPAGVALEQIQ